MEESSQVNVLSKLGNVGGSFGLILISHKAQNKLLRIRGHMNDTFR